MSDVTIVTAFVDIGRGGWEGEINGRQMPGFLKRDTETYLKRFERLTKLKNPIVCFTESKFHDQILSMRDDITLIGIDNVFEDHQHLINKISYVQLQPSFVNFVNNPAAPEYWSPKYVTINLMKSHFVSYAVEQGIVNTSNAAWIDFGYVRDDVFCPEDKTWYYDTEGKINLFCQNFNFKGRPIFDIVKTGEVFIQGCHIVAPKQSWKILKHLVNENLTSLFNVDLIDDDQTLLLMSYKSAPEHFKLIPSDSSNWFTVFEGRCE